MDVKIVAVLGSPHGMKGATGALLNRLTQSAVAAGADVKTFNLAEMTVKPCHACDACHRTGQCSITDDFATLKSALLAADGIVLASPNYISSVSAQMKAVLDRCCGPLHCQSMAGKYGVAVVTSGGGESEEVERYILRFLQNMGCWTVGSVGAEARHLADAGARAERLNAAASLGAQLVATIRARKTFPEQENMHRAFYDRMKMLVTHRKKEWTYEHEYWKSLGRL